jgi:hypothetical protein
LQNKLATLSANSVHQTTQGATHAALLEEESISSATSRAIGDVVRAVRDRKQVDERQRVGEHLG